MRPWLLLVSLLVSDLSPLGDGDWVMENYSWSLYRKLLLNGQMTPRGLEILQPRAERHCMCIQRNCVRVAVQHKHRTFPFYCEFTVRDDRGCSSSHQEFAGIIHRTHLPALVISVLRGEGKRVLVRSGSPSVLHVIDGVPLKKAGGKSSHTAMDLKDQPDSGSAWLLHHHTAASGHNFPAAIVHVQKMLTKRGCAATTVIIGCCLKKAEIRSALKIQKTPEQQMAQAQIRHRENRQRAVGLQVLMEYDGRRPSAALVTLHSGSSSEKTSDTSQLETQREGVRLTETNGHLDWDEEWRLQKRVERQRSLEAASHAHDDDDDDDDDGFDVQKQLLMAAREKTESINRRRDKMKAGKIITKQAEFRRPGGGSEGEQSQERLTRIRQADFTHKADNDDVNHKQMLIEAGEGVLIMLFLSNTDEEAQTEASRQRKLLLNTDTGWKTVIIPTEQTGDPPPVSTVKKEIFIIEARNSKCTCLKGSSLSLEIKVSGRTEGRDLKPAESAAEVTTASANTEQVKEGRDGAETSGTPEENTGINQTKQEENAPSDQSVTASPPSLQMTETETTKTDHTATESTEIKETTPSTEASSRAGTQTADGQSAAETPTTAEGPHTEPTATRWKTNNDTQAAAERPLSGLRMRDDVELQEDSDTEGRAATSRPGSETREAQDGPGVSSEVHERAADQLPQASDDRKPLCRGLIHRTEAGWRHCVDRLAGKMSSSREPTDPRQDEAEQQHKDDDYGHFYYFDGVLRRVRPNFYPYYRTQKKRHGNAERGVFTGDRRGHLLGHIRRLALRNRQLRMMSRAK